MLGFDADTGRLYSQEMGIDFADRPYSYALSGCLVGGERFSDSGLTAKGCRQHDNETIVTGRFAKAHIELSQVFRHVGEHLEETITLKNAHTQPVTLSGLEIGFDFVLVVLDHAVFEEPQGDHSDGKKGKQDGNEKEK